MIRPSTTNEFINRALQLHRNKYEYSKVIYINNHTKVEIICHTHGSFWQKPNHHLSSKRGCPECSGNKKLTTETFIKRANIIHNDFYNYSNVIYTNGKTKINIICPKHGEFLQNAHTHLQGRGCYNCGNDYNSTNNADTQEVFLQKCKEKHGTEYDYSNTNYKRSDKKINIICKKHGVFLMTPHHHLQGQGCPKCSLFVSRGEKSIMKWLDDNRITYNHQYKFNDCRNPITNRRLKFDFYIPTNNILIEFDGQQHFRIGSKVHKHILTINEIKNIQKRDEIKNDYVLKNNIKLIRIPYTKMKSINQILEKVLL